MDWWQLWIDNLIKSWTAWHKIRFYESRKMGSSRLWHSSDLIIPMGIYWNLYRSNNQFCGRKSAESLDQILLIGLLPVWASLSSVGNRGLVDKAGVNGAEVVSIKMYGNVRGNSGMSFFIFHDGIYIKYTYIRQIKHWGYIYIHNMNIIMPERVEAIRLIYPIYFHDDVMIRKRFPHYTFLYGEIHRQISLTRDR